ncbi:MAG: glutamate racemase [Clostridiales bacterium]|nr:glutamate racemase [Clostridiales bacterium]
MPVREKDKPIGVFDSGVGGLSVLRALTRKLPGESFVYFGDTARVPYGDLSPEEVCRYTVEIGEWLLDRGCEMIVIACNTATVMGMAALRRVTEAPVLGMVEAAVDAVLNDSGDEDDADAGGAHRRGVGIWPLGLIATQGTLDSGVYQSAFAERAPGKPLYTQACPDFTALVEVGRTEGPDVDRAINIYLTGLTEKKIRTLVLGCTHYPFLAPALSAFMGEGVKLVDPALRLASMAGERLARNRTANIGAIEAADTGENPGAVEFWCSGDTAEFKAVGGILLGCPVDVVKRKAFGS